MNVDEPILGCAKRELYEETGLDIAGHRFQFVCYRDDPNRDKRQRVITFGFLVTIPYEIPVEGKDDAVSAGWYSIPEHLESVPLNMAFDHNLIVVDAVKLAFPNAFPTLKKMENR